MCHASASDPPCVLDAASTDAPTTACGDGVIAVGEEGCDDGDLDDGDGCSAHCIVEDDYVCREQPSVCLRRPLSGELVLSEIMKNPGGDDTNREWFEVTNVSEFSLELGALIVRDDGFDAFTIDGSLPIRPGQALVMASNDNRATNGGVPVDYEYSDFFVLSNGIDEIELFSPALDVVIDRVAYNSVSFPDAEGASLSLGSDAYDVADNDLGVNWCLGTTPFGDGDRGTPGEMNPPCPPLGTARAHGSPRLTPGAKRRVGRRFPRGRTWTSATVAGDGLRRARPGGFR